MGETSLFLRLLMPNPLDAPFPRKRTVGCKHSSSIQQRHCALDLASYSLLMRALGFAAPLPGSYHRGRPQLKNLRNVLLFAALVAARFGNVCETRAAESSKVPLSSRPLKIQPPRQLPPAVTPDVARRIDIRLSTFHLTTNFVIAEVQTGEPPDRIALMVQPELAWEKLTWIPFSHTLPIDLGPGDGSRMIWIAGMWGNGKFRRANGTQVWVDHAAPRVVITNPVERVTSRPMIQLQGFSDEPVESIRYDVISASNRIENVQGFVNDQHYDRKLFQFTTNYFTCYDIDLSLGTNTIVLRCEDLAGNISTNMYNFIFRLDQDKTPPVLSLDRPMDGHQLSGDTFTARGQLDDPTARVMAIVSASGHTNTIPGLVEREGYFWVEHIPLAQGANSLTITATDAAGNASRTNLVVYKSEGILSIDDVPDASLLREHVTVTGKVSPAEPVWVNGVRAEVKPDGTWVAKNVPVLSPDGGTAVFEATGIPPPEAKPAVGAMPKEVVTAAARLGTNAITMNARTPARGLFKLHLTGTTGRSFMLLASTNLVNWTAILTNSNSEATFDFVDTNAAAYRCRFFRVVPIP
jgi:hypothetical protein